MNDYESSAPRAVLALAALAMTTITMGALVVLPAKFDSVGADASTLAAAKAATQAPIEVVASRALVDAPTEGREVLARPGRATIGVQVFRRGGHASRVQARTNF